MVPKLSLKWAKLQRGNRKAEERKKLINNNNIVKQQNRKEKDKRHTHTFIFSKTIQWQYQRECLSSFGREIYENKLKVKESCAYADEQTKSPKELGKIVIMAMLIKSKVHTVIFSIILIVLENWEIVNAQQQQQQQSPQQLQQTKGKIIDINDTLLIRLQS